MKKLIFTGLATLGLLTGAAAIAQPAPPPAGGGWHVRHQEARLNRLKAQLQITSTQEPAWNTFVTAMKDMRPQWEKGGMMGKPVAGLTPAPKVFDKLAQFAEQRAAKAKQLARAADRLYRELTPVQRAVLNTHLADMRQAMHHFRRMRHNGHKQGGWVRHGARPMPPVTNPPMGAGNGG